MSTQTEIQITKLKDDVASILSWYNWVAAMIVVVVYIFAFGYWLGSDECKLKANNHAYLATYTNCYVFETIRVESIP